MLSAFAQTEKVDSDWWVLVKEIYTCKILATEEAIFILLERLK